MPTYEYKNIETGEIYEFKQSMRDDAFTHHPETGAAIKRIVSVPGIAFKGSGFYANDSRSSGPGTKAGGQKADSSGGDAAAKSGDSAPAASAAATPAASSGSTSSGSTGSGSTGTASPGKGPGKGGE